VRFNALRNIRRRIHSSLRWLAANRPSRFWSHSIDNPCKGSEEMTKQMNRRLAEAISGAEEPSGLRKGKGSRPLSDETQCRKTCYLPCVTLKPNSKAVQSAPSEAVLEHSEQGGRYLKLSTGIGFSSLLEHYASPCSVFMRFRVWESHLVTRYGGQTTASDPGCAP